ncbi:hypothetical protein HDV05_000491 [Chytridiales sp. JEL 0842]|nr:hypothetical protein HDV05_000491 [Chytridiales sp. JEL 0842]
MKDSHVVAFSKHEKNKNKDSGKSDEQDKTNSSGGKKKKEPEPPLDPVEYWTIMAFIFFLVILGGMFAGLTIGLMSLDETNLSILKRSGTPQERKYAEQIEPIRRNTHLLLVTLLLSNTVVNETLPVLFHAVQLEGYQAVLFSTVLVVIFGEIIPQAVCARYGLQVGAIFAWPVRILIWIVYIIAYPIAKLLDWILGQKDAVIYRRAQLKELIAMHDEDHSGPLTLEEVNILRAILELRDKTVTDVMTKLSDVLMLPLNSKLDRATISNLLHAGHSRVPVYNDSQEDIIGVVLVKQLVLLDPDDETPLTDIKIGRLPRVRSETPLYEILHVFEQGGSHMAVVVEEVPLEHPDPNSFITASPLWVSNSPVGMSRRFKTLGIVTLEDVIEEMIGQEIIDETDVYVDVGAKVKVARAFHEMERRLVRSKGNTGPNSPNPAQSSTPVDLSSADLEILESTPLLPPAIAHLKQVDYGASRPSTTTLIPPGGSPNMQPSSSSTNLTRTRGHLSKRFRDDMVSASQLVEEAKMFSKGILPSQTSQGAGGLRILGGGVDAGQEHLESVHVKIEKDEHGYIVDGTKFYPSPLKLDDPPSSSEKPVPIDTSSTSKAASDSSSSSSSSNHSPSSFQIPLPNGGTPSSIQDLEKLD